MEKQQSTTFTIIALNDEQASVMGSRYIGRLKPHDEPAVWFAAAGQCVICSAIVDSGIAFNWLPVELGIHTKGSWDGPIQVDYDKLNKLKDAVSNTSSKLLGS